MAVKLTVLLFNAVGPSHCCQHIAAILTDLTTGRTCKIEHGGAENGKVFANLDLNPLTDHIDNSCIRCGTTTLYSSKDFDKLVKSYLESYEHENYDFCTKNCANAVDFMIDEVATDKVCCDMFCLIYHASCTPCFIGSLGLLNCFPAIPGCCITPQDTYDKAKWLSRCTDYGNPKSIFSTAKTPLLQNCVLPNSSISTTNQVNVKSIRKEKESPQIKR